MYSMSARAEYLRGRVGRVGLGCTLLYSGWVWVFTKAAARWGAPGRSPMLHARQVVQAVLVFPAQHVLLGAFHLPGRDERLRHVRLPVCPRLPGGGGAGVKGRRGVGWGVPRVQLPRRFFESGVKILQHAAKTPPRRLVRHRRKQPPQRRRASGGAGGAAAGRTRRRPPPPPSASACAACTPHHVPRAPAQGLRLMARAHAAHGCASPPPCPPPAHHRRTARRRSRRSPTSCPTAASRRGGAARPGRGPSSPSTRSCGAGWGGGRGGGGAVRVGGSGREDGA